MKQATQKPSRNPTCCGLPRHTHQHGPGCGHKTVKHGRHLDYVHNGRYHRVHGEHTDECAGPGK